MEIINLSEWVKAARTHKNLTQEELALEIGFSSKTSISAMERGVNQPTFEAVFKISQICSFPMPYQNIIPVESTEAEEQIVALPIFQGVHTSSILNIKGMIMEKNYEIFHTPAVILQNASVSEENAFCMVMEGDSMHPNIPDGSIVFIDISSKNIVEGKLYAVFYNGLVRIRRLYCLADNLLNVKAFNNLEYPDQVIEADKLEVIGKVFGGFVQLK